MKKYTILFSFFLFFLNFAFLYSQDLLQEGIKNLKSGDLVEAKKSFQAYLNAHPKAPEASFYLAQIESDGKSSAQALVEFYKNHPTTNLSDQAFMWSLQFDFSQGNYIGAIEKFKEFKKLFPKSPLISQISWLYASSLLATDQSKLAEKEFRKIIKSNPQSEWAQWAQMGVGDCFFVSGKFAEATIEYKKVLGEYSSSETSPPALVGLIKSLYQLGEIEKATLYYNLYKDKFASGIQGSQSFSQIVALSSQSKIESSEKISGVQYTIQVGVFSSEKNASQMAKKFKLKGHKVFQPKKEVDKKSYFTVQIGIFDSYEKAQTFKEKLEKEFNESYYIVIK
jgi:TolA-binding protein